MIGLRAVLIATLYVVTGGPSSKSCNDRAMQKGNAETGITKISYSTTGGRSGNYESLNVTADSLVYLQARRGEEKTTSEKTPTDLWRQLVASINLNDFDRIKSNPGHALYDGIDTTLSIESAAKTHTLVNGNEDPDNYKRIKPFTELLEKTVAEQRQKMVW